MFQDIQYGLRSLLRSPEMTLAAVLTLALGIGANTAIFSGVNAIFVNPTPGVTRSGELVELYVTDRSRGTLDASSPEYRDYRDRGDMFSGLLAYGFFPSVLSTSESTDRIWSLLVSSNYFDVLGVRALLGRTLQSSDDDGGGSSVVVIGYGLWQRRFAGRKAIVGATITINGQPFTIVGVAPAEFRGTFPGLVFDAWLPLPTEDRLIAAGHSTDRTIRWLSLVGRLKPAMGLNAAEARLRLVAEDLARSYPKTNTALSASLYPPWRSPRGAPALMGPLLLVLMGVMALLLLLTCANVANLLVARGVARQREIAIRLTLGASRARLVRQLLVESLELAALGGLAGLFVGHWTASWLGSFLPEVDVPLDFRVSLEPGILSFAVAVTVASALFFGVLPARQAARTALVPALKDGGLGAVGARSRTRLRNSLVVVQMALSLVLLVAAGLFLRSLVNAQAVDPGFNPRGVLVGVVG